MTARAWLAVLVLAGATVAADETGQLELSSSPPGARLTVNGADVGFAPVTSPPIAPGVYEIAATWPEGQTATATATVRAGEVTRVTVEGSGAPAAPADVTAAPPPTTDRFYGGSAATSSRSGGRTKSAVTFALGTLCPDTSRCHWLLRFGIEGRFADFHGGLVFRPDSYVTGVGPTLGFAVGTPYFDLADLGDGSAPRPLKLAIRADLDFTTVFYPGEHQMFFAPTNTFGPNLSLGLTENFGVFTRLGLGWNLAAGTDFTTGFRCCQTNFAVEWVLGARYQ